MFIQNPVWKSVPATNLTAPVLEGTVLSKEGEVVWAPDGISSDATPYGVVTETINILPPTMLINVAVGGTIDLKLPGNEVAQDYPEDILTTMWDNINFIQFSELDGQDIEPATRLEYFLQRAATEVPKPTAADAGKVITVNQDGDGYELTEKSVKYYPLVVESIGNPYTHASTELTILSHPDHLDIVNFVRAGGAAYIALYMGSLEASTVFYIPVTITVDSASNKSFTAELNLHYGNNQAPTTVLQTYRVTCNNGTWASRYWNVKIASTDYTS